MDISKGPPTAKVLRMIQNYQLLRVQGRIFNNWSQQVADSVNMELSAIGGLSVPVSVYCKEVK